MRDCQSHSIEQTPGGVWNVWVRSLTGFLWCETFIGVGIQCFWVLAKSSPLAVNNGWDGVLALLPFVCMMCAGFGACHGGIRHALRRLEGIFHLGACAVQLALLLFLVWRDPFTSIVPLASPMVLWSVGLSCVLLANGAAHCRDRGDGAPGTPAWSPLAALGFLLLWWVGTVWLGAGMAWVAFSWSASIVLHALAAPVAVRGARSAAVIRPQGERFAAPVETLFWLAFLLMLQVRDVSQHPCMGTFETKAFLYLDLYRSPLFMAGMVLSLAAMRARIAPMAHSMALAAVVFTPPGGGGLVAVAAGYAFPALFRATRRLHPAGYALAGAAMAFIWFLGLAGFAFSGMIVDYASARGIVHGILKWGGVVSAGFLALWFATMAWERRRHVPVIEVPHTVRAISPALVGCVLLGLALVPGVLLLVHTAWPPFFVGRPLRQPVGEPMGICHASPSKADPDCALLDTLGVQAVRMGFAWRRIQPSPDQWRDEPFDAYLRDVPEGRRVVGTLDYDNDDVEQDPAGKTRDKYIAPADIPVFLTYVRHVVERYKGRISAWEIWNEPDIPRFWRGTMEEFFGLARQTAGMIRALDADTPIFGPPMTSPFGVETPRGIEESHTAGVLALTDHPNGHLYLTDPRHYYYEYMKLIAAARRFHHPGATGITELGSPDGGFYPWRSEGDLLAGHVIKAYTIATSLGVSLVNWYCLQDDPADKQRQQPGDSEYCFGLFRADGTMKPSAHAYGLFSRYCTRCEMRGDLVRASGGLAARQVRSALYRRNNGESALVLWYEPMLRPWGQVQVRLDLGALAGPAVIHDIASGYAKEWFGGHIAVGEKPVMLTFKSVSTETPVVWHATGSPVDACWLLSLAALAVVSGVWCRRWREAAIPA